MKIMNNEIISSIRNPQIRRLQDLQKSSSERRAMGLFVAEGYREIQHCLEAGYEIKTLYYSSPLLKESINDINAQTYIEVAPELYSRIAYRGTTEGVIATVCIRNTKLQELKLRKNPLVVVLESVEKPGNLGAVLRSADAAHVDAVIVCDPLTDLYNPNLIRSSVGAVFTVPCIVCSSEECIAFLKEHGIRILTAQLQDSDLYYDVDMRQPTAIVMGTEATGLTPQWREAADAHIRIPMQGRLDSLNVSVSAAILIFEAVRQRLSVTPTR